MSQARTRAVWRVGAQIRRSVKASLAHKSDLHTRDDLVVRPPNGRRRHLVVDVLLITIAVTIALKIFFHLSGSLLRSPLGYSGDSLAAETSAKNIIQTGWMQTAPRLGAPFGAKFYDYPLGADNGHYLLMRLLALFTSNWVVLVNSFYFISFYTAAWSAYLCQRWLRVGRTSAMVTSILFAFAPYHFARGVNHLELASYAVVPIGVLVAIRAATVPLPPAQGRWRWVQIRKLMPWAILCALVASGGAYYAIFGMLSLSICGLFMAGVGRSWRPLLRCIAFGFVILAVFIFNLGGSILYRRAHGVNTSVAMRVPIELDLYSLRLIQLISPVTGHWFRPFAHIATSLAAGYTSEPTQFLGLVGGVALVWMLGWLLSASTVPHRTTDYGRSLLVAITVAFILIGETGGLSWIISLTGFTQIRAWNRVSIEILFCALSWMGIMLGPITRRAIARRPRMRRVALVGAVGLLFFGLADQGSLNNRPSPKPWQDAYSSDREFFASVEAQLPVGASVYQLPYRRFPEEPPLYGSGDYDLFRPFLNTNKLRFSYGGVKGREADWQDELLDVGPDRMVPVLLAMGFRAIIMDRFGYADRGTELAKAITTETTVDPTMSADSRWFFFDLTGQDKRYADIDLPALREQVVSQVRVVLSGCSGTEGVGEGRFHWCGRKVVGIPARTVGEPVGFSYTFGVDAPAGNGVLHVNIDGSINDYPIGPAESTVTLYVAAGQHQKIEMKADVPAVVPVSTDTRDLRFRIINPQIVFTG